MKHRVQWPSEQWIICTASIVKTQTLPGVLSIFHRMKIFKGAVIFYLIVVSRDSDSVRQDKDYTQWYSRPFSNVAKKSMKSKSFIIVYSKSSACNVTLYWKKIEENGKISRYFSKLNPLLGRYPNNMDRPSAYGNPTVQDVRYWIDEATDPSNPNIKDFTYDYWNAL